MARIIIVDDSATMRQQVRRALEPTGLSIAEAVDGQDGLEKINADSEIDVVILDVNMPRMNGIEFLDVLRADVRLARSMVFVLSTSKDPRDRRAAYARGVAGYISKDSVAPDYADLAALIRAYVDLVTLPEPAQP